MQGNEEKHMNEWALGCDVSVACEGGCGFPNLTCNKIPKAYCTQCNEAIVDARCIAPAFIHLKKQHWDHQIEDSRSNKRCKVEWDENTFLGNEEKTDAQIRILLLVYLCLFIYLFFVIYIYFDCHLIIAVIAVLSMDWRFTCWLVFLAIEVQKFLSMASMYFPTWFRTTMLSGIPKVAKITQNIWPSVVLGVMFP